MRLKELRIDFESYEEELRLREKIAKRDVFNGLINTLKADAFIGGKKAQLDNLFGFDTSELCKAIGIK